MHRLLYQGIITMDVFSFLFFFRNKSYMFIHTHTADLHLLLYACNSLLKSTFGVKETMLKYQRLSITKADKLHPQRYR